MQAVGLPATAIDSSVLPNWRANSTVGVVPVETAAQATEAVARSGEVGFRGVAIESSTAACEGLDVVPADATLGFVDVPFTHPDQSAIQWVVNTSLLEACNPPAADQFCPDALVTQGELALVLGSALATPPAAPADPNAPATVSDLEAALGSDSADTTPLLRRTLASTLLNAYNAAG